MFSVVIVIWIQMRIVHRLHVEHICDVMLLVKLPIHVSLHK